jgi:hypothetical protein
MLPMYCTVKSIHLYSLAANFHFGKCLSLAGLLRALPVISTRWLKSCDFRGSEYQREPLWR